MTGREFILYILTNQLEDEQMFDENGRILGFMTVQEVAAKFDVGISTVRFWISQGRLQNIYMNDRYYIPANAELKEVSDAVSI